jgi:hypothetical protein
MSAQVRKHYQPPTEDQVIEARRVLAALRQSRLRARRRARRSLPRGVVAYPTAAYTCGYCGIAFEGRRGNYGSVRWCSDSCRTMGYLQRQKAQALREKRAARLSGAEPH